LAFEFEATFRRSIMDLFDALAHRPFLLLWSGQTLSRFGDSLRQLALAWWVLEQTGSAEAMSMLMICATIPTFAFALLGGVAGDRLPRASLMTGADTMRAGLSAGLAALAAAQQLALGHLFVASVLFGLLNAFFLPAYTALLPEVTPAPLRASANALTSLSAEICGVAGPALGALLLGWGGVALLFALDAGTFLAAALCLLFGAGGDAKTRRGEEATSFTSSLLRLFASNPARICGSLYLESRLPAWQAVLRDLGAGQRAIAGTRWLWTTIGLLALLNLTGRSPMQVALPLLAREHLRAGAGTLGLLYTTFSLGSIAGALAAGRGARSLPRGPLIYRALALVGLLTLTLGVSRHSLASALAIFALGMALALANLTWTQLVQERVPPQLQGRVASAALLGSSSLLPLGFGMAGWAADRFGPGVVFVVGGALTAALALAGLATRTVRELE
jgi:MFS family permease